MTRTLAPRGKPWPGNHHGVPASDRFWVKVNKNGPVPSGRADLGPCWLWTGSAGSSTHGRFCDGSGSEVQAYRWSYENAFGPIPKAFVVHHICCNPPCVNPAHLEAIPFRENVLRGGGPTACHSRATHCPSGHPYDLFNTYWSRTRRGLTRVCKQCSNRHKAKWARKKARREAIAVS